MSLKNEFNEKYLYSLQFKENANDFMFISNFQTNKRVTKLQNDIAELINTDLGGSSTRPRTRFSTKKWKNYQILPQIIQNAENSLSENLLIDQVKFLPFH